MKKSQVLAALALAFALGLGVVAPVANTYAYTLTGTEGVSDTQKKTLGDDIIAAKKAFNELDKANEYIALYDSVEFVTDFLKTADKSTVTLYKTGNFDGSVTRSSVNATIDALSNLLYKTNGLYQKSGDTYVNLLVKTPEIKFDQAKLIDLSTLDDNVSDASAAYGKVKTLLNDVNNNLDVLKNNYKDVDTTGAIANDVKLALLSLKAAATGWLSEYDSLHTITNGATPVTPADYVTANIAPINSDTSDNLLNGKAWTDAGKDTYSANAVRYNLFISTAKATPKYCTVKALKEAKSKFDKFDTTESVDYVKAVEYVNAFNVAIKNFRDGNCNTNNGTGDGTNKEDEKNPNLTSPDTGALNAEGNATTTVAMVAGVATALTAAGAGVVAYRNARRSTRK